LDNDDALSPPLDTYTLRERERERERALIGWTKKDGRQQVLTQVGWRVGRVVTAYNFSY
jgi:hypothetical protein